MPMTTGPGDYKNAGLPQSGPEFNQRTGKKPFYKKKWFIVSAAAVVLVGAISGGSDEEAPADQSSSIASPDSSIAVQANAEAEPESTPNPESAPVSESASASESTPESEPQNDEAVKSGSYTLPSGMKIYFNDSVRNDVTGKWRISTTSDSFVPADYAVEYYEMMFSSDDEIHAIWNAALKTTTRISVLGNLLLVDTMEYVDKEEHDAKLLFSGALLDSRVINLETGETTKAAGVDVKENGSGSPENTPEETSVPEDPTDGTGTEIPLPEESSSAEEPASTPDTEGSSSAAEPEPTPDVKESSSTPEPASTPDTSAADPPKQSSSAPSKSSGGSGNADNFNTYDNPDQQKTNANYVLNTNTMKFHYPTCKSVKKIAPQNYEEFYGTRDEVISMGYKSCGICHP